MTGIDLRVSACQTGSYTTGLSQHLESGFDSFLDHVAIHQRANYMYHFYLQEY